MCVEAKNRQHICGLCVKLKNLLKIHLAKVGARVQPVLRNKPISKLRSKYVEENDASVEKAVDEHWAKLCSIKSEDMTEKDTDVDTSFLECDTSLEISSDAKRNSEDKSVTFSLERREKKRRRKKVKQSVEVQKDCDDGSCYIDQDEVALPVLRLAKSPIQSYESEIFICDVDGCGKKFNSNMAYRRHKTSHDKERKHACTLCEARFRQPIHLTEHMLSHSKERPHACPCGRSFQTNRQLRKHRFRNESQACLIYEEHSDTEQNESETSPEKEPQGGIKLKLKIKSTNNMNKNAAAIASPDISDSTKAPFECEVCGDIFNNRGRLKWHYRKHGGDKPYICDHEQCGQAFSSKKALKRHRITHVEKNYNCKECQLQFKEPSELHEHMFVHSQGGNAPFMCFCGKYFFSAAKLREHKIVHDDSRPFACPKCNKAFKRAINLKEHMYTHEENKPYVCHCGKKFAAAPLLKRHQTRDHRGDAYTPNPKNTVYGCEVCPATFKRKAFLFRHMKTHILKNASYCAICKKQFPTEEDLIKHICAPGDSLISGNAAISSELLATNEGVNFISEEDYEKKVKTFLCELCGKGYANNSKLNEHKKIHTGELPFKCNVCSKGFSENYKLVNHMVTHTSTLEERRNIPCEYCGRCFTSKLALVNHIRTHTGERPFQCPQCDYRSIQASSLHNHMATHSTQKNFECKQCNKRFKLKWSLVLHMKRHAGETKHACSICDKRFLTTSQLKKHMFVHSEARPFQCPMCGSAFKRSDALKNHMDRHASDHGSLKPEVSRQQPIKPEVQAQHALQTLVNMDAVQFQQMFNPIDLDKVSVG